jgi:hypothetical protein
MPFLGTELTSRDVRFSNRPFGGQALSDYPLLQCRCYSVDVARGLVLLFGIGTKALVWGFCCQAGVMHFFRCRFLGSILPGLVLTTSSAVVRAG